MKPITAYAITSESGRALLSWTIRQLRRDAIRDFCLHVGDGWGKLQAQGHRMVMVEVRPVDE